MQPSKAEVADETGCGNPAKQGAVWCNAMDPMARATPDVACFIDANAIGMTNINSVKITAARQLSSPFLNIKQMNQSIR